MEYHFEIDITINGHVIIDDQYCKADIEYSADPGGWMIGDVYVISTDDKWCPAKFLEGQLRQELENHESHIERQWNERKLDEVA